MPNATITLTLTAEDFEKIVQTSTEWGKQWMKQKDRFEGAPLFTWKMAYWVDSYLEALVCQHYLSVNGFESQTVWDRGMASTLILTNYESWCE